MPEYAYTKVLGKLREFLGKVRTLGVPPNLTIRWLESIGFKSKNDRSILAVIRQIRFIDDNNIPTEKWSKYRGLDHKKVLAEGILEGYADLYSIYPDAHNRTNDELENYFSTKTPAAKQVVSATAATFKTLCELADFSTTVEISALGNNSAIIEKPLAAISLPIENSTLSKPNFTPKVHIDIQIHITPEATPQQIDKIFESMAKHLYRLNE